MKISLGQLQSGQLTLTPQLQKAIKLLQMSSLEMEQELLAAAEDNPFLEYDPSPEDEYLEAIPEFSHRTSSTQAQRIDPEDMDQFATIAEEVTLLAHLMSQVGTVRVDSSQKKILEYLVGCLDDRGYLRENLDEIEETLREFLDPEEGKPRNQIQACLEILHSFDPPGIGAFDLAQCLSIQLHKLPATLQETPAFILCEDIIASHLDLVGSKNWLKLKQLTKCKEDDLKLALEMIQGLNPSPCDEFISTKRQIITPDVIVRKTSKGWEAILNPNNQPRVSLRTEYVGMIKSQKPSPENEVFFQKFGEAKILIKQVQQRSETILKVAKAIVQRQQSFFDFGELGMKPLLLKEIAEEVGVHESTISRVTNEKYLTCIKGTFSLKYFFGAQVVQDEGMNQVSSQAIKALIKKIVEAEPSTKPISDGAISDLLAREGYQIARRTVAKYREALRIPPVSLRKSWPAKK
jgi:RNA polymerase sigma-54 factor